MSRLKQFQERQKKMTRFQVLKSIFSSLFLTAAVVVIAVSVIPKSPLGIIETIDAYTDTVTYTVRITDEDNAILEDSLQISLDNQFEHYEKPLAPGSSSGLFQNLTPETSYTLKILADKGFGLEVLDRKTVTTAPKTGGAFTGVSLTSPENEWQLSYAVDYFISDPFDTYRSVELHAMYRYSPEEDFQNEVIIPLSKTASSTAITQIPNENVEVRLVLFATDTDNQTTELGRLTFHTPVVLYASMEMMQVTSDMASFQVWPDSYSGLEIRYELALMQGDFEVRREVVDLSSFDPMMHQFDSEPQISFENLFQNTTYSAVLHAIYQDPYTLETVDRILATQSFMTAPRLRQTLTYELVADHYEVTITLDHPTDVYDFAYYQTYVYDIDHYVQSDDQAFAFSLVDGAYVAQFSIPKPTTSDFKIEIGIRQSSTYYYFVILETINQQEG